ncbi:TetR/AcrR family transcriptional regulator [Dactylosporangium cerinum]|uniref:TetR/AcrR family transcriptional regulator n=1 Tax=Dactylosporangium cerinum TaxID=1434730 RepID=A0ABV9W7Y8_9ACTN
MSQAGATTKGAARRSQILDAATAILVEEGQGHLTLRSVADRVGIRLSNVQYYFKTRDSLVAALLEHYLTGTLQRLSAPLSVLTLPEVVRRVLDEQCDRNASVFFTELWSLAGHRPQIEAAVRTFYRTYESLVAEQLRAARPELPPAELAARARVFVMLLEGAQLFRAGVAADPDAPSDALLYKIATGLLA